MTVFSADGTLQCDDDRRSGVLRNPAHPLHLRRQRLAVEQLGAVRAVALQKARG